MTKRHAFIFGLLLAATAGAKDVRYLALGDSFTIGTGTSPDLAFPARLAALATARGSTVVLENLAVNGYSTEELIAHELPAVKRFAPTHVTLAIGANDFVRGRSPSDYRKNLKLIFAALKRDGVVLSRVWVLPQPDWARSPAAKAFGDPDQMHAQIVRYNAILAEEAKAAGAHYVDLFPLMEQQAAARLVAPDGLHPSAAAHAAWAERLDRELGLK